VTARGPARCEGCGSPDRLFRVTVKPVKGSAAGGTTPSVLGVACWYCVEAMSIALLEREPERRPA